ncbi:MAG TPA: zf-HC2 domain-containing protein [Pyrinomonadaceae bacterium]|jgi:hypothetical protein
MNCKHVQELLPLYVGRDLEEKRAQLVTAHVQSCTECANSADEYRESRQLLQQFAPPPFNEAVYTGIRQRVLREIGRESSESVGSALPNFVASLFRPRLRWAFATALLLAVSVFAFYFIAKQRNERQESRDNQLAAAPSPSRKENNSPPFKSTGRNTGVHMTTAGSGDHTHQSQRRKTSGPAADRATPHAVNTPDNRSLTAQASPESNNLAIRDAVPAPNPATAEKTLRVEMQTNNPNIRIIWFSTQRTKQNSPGKSTKAIREVRSYA